MVNKRRRKKELLQALNEASDYPQWLDAARALDELNGALAWRATESSRFYDYRNIRKRLNRLRALRKKGDNHGLLFALNEGIHGNMGGMGRPLLYNRAYTGTKILIEEYVDEISSALVYLADLDDPEISFSEKLDFFRRASHCYGRTALMLSGGATLATFHIGVIRALLEQQLVPTVLSGSSAGALVAAVLGTHHDDELKEMLQPHRLIVKASQEASILERLLMQQKGALTAKDLRRNIARLIPDLTFQEAFELTGRKINVSVAPADVHQTSRLLNAVASPNVLIRSAVLASTAIPGVFPPVTLQARNAQGKRQTYLPGRQWVDGSMTDDLPAKRLSRLYGVNHFIVSLVNPLALPFARRQKDEEQTLLSLAGQIGHYAVRESLQAYQNFSRRYISGWKNFNLGLNTLHSLMDQQYSGDINIVLDLWHVKPLKFLAELTEDEASTLIAAGEQATWPKIAMIRNCTRISQTLDQILERYDTREHQLLEETDATAGSN